MANEFGARWNYQHPSEVMDEIASLTPMFAGVNYERLAGYKSLQWPVAADGSDEPLLYTKRFAFPDGNARLFPVSWIGPTDQPNAEFDLHLNNGRLLEHFHEGNLTYRTEGIREKTPDTFVEVSPELAEERGIQSGTWVQLISRYGKVRVRALVTDRVHGTELYMPMNSVESPVNRLTSSHTDPVTNTPAYKETSVHMNVLAEVGESPLPRINSRFGHPTPQNGVEVERKWKRADYAPPGNGNGLVQLQTKKCEESSMAQPIPWKFHRVTRARSCAPDWSRLPKNMRKRCWPHTKCSSSCTSAACWRSCAVPSRRATKFWRKWSTMPERPKPFVPSEISCSGVEFSAASNRSGSRASFRQFQKVLQRPLRNERNQSGCLDCYEDS